VSSFTEPARRCRQGRLRARSRYLRRCKLEPSPATASRDRGVEQVRPRYGPGARAPPSSGGVSGERRTQCRQSRPGWWGDHACPGASHSLVRMDPRRPRGCRERDVGRRSSVDRSGRHRRRCRNRGSRGLRGRSCRHGRRRRIGHGWPGIRLRGLVWRRRCRDGLLRRRERMRVRRRRRRRSHCRRLRRAGEARVIRGSVRVGYRPSRQKREWIDVALLVVGMTDAEIDVGLWPVGLAARPDRRHRHSFRNRLALTDAQRPEMLQRHGIAVRGTDGQGLAALGHRARERDHTGRGSGHVRAEVARDVDATVLPRRIGIVSDHERSKYPSLRGPGPRLRGAGNEAGND
jgi:hypothetical protein